MQVKINRKALHYRWYRYIGNQLLNEGEWEAPKSVCGYFWGFIFKNLQAMFMVIAAMLMIAAAIYILTAPVWYQFYPEFTPNGENGKGVAYAGLAIEAFALLIFLMTIISKKDSGFIAIIKAYLWGIKNKVCPMITYEGEE